MTSLRVPVPSRALLSKVPEVTLYFWLTKVLCTTVGESAADFLNVDLGFGLTGVSVVTGVLLVVALVFHFRATRYVAGLYPFDRHATAGSVLLAGHPVHLRPRHGDR